MDVGVCAVAGHVAVEVVGYGLAHGRGVLVQVVGGEGFVPADVRVRGEQVVAHGEVVDQAGCVVAVGESHVPARGGVGDA